MSLNTTPRTWVTGEVVTAAEMNTEIRDALTGIESAWTAYTPTLTSITLGNGTLKAAYLQIGKTILVRFSFVAGSTTTYSAGSLAFSLPVTPHADYTGSTAANNWAVGSAIVNPAGTRLAATPIITNTGTLGFITDSATSSTPVTNTAPSTWGTSGILAGTVQYEAA